MMGPHKISIVLPTYNGAKYIQQSIVSCLNQTYRNIELIIIDDGSTDDTPKIIKSYTDKRIKYLRHDENSGLPQALNTGFAHATGDYLTWTSDDNYFSEKALEIELSFLTENHCLFVYCDFYKIDNDNSKLSVERLDDALQLENGNGVGPCFLYSKTVKEATGDYDVHTKLAEDYDYWIRISKKFVMHHLAEPLYYYREHANSLSQSRFYEIKIVDILVRCKNGILTDNAIGSLAHMSARRYPIVFGLRKLIQIYLKRKLKSILLTFQTGKLSFNDAKIAIKRILVFE